MDELQLITTGVMGLVSLYHICPSKVRAYNSKVELIKCCKLVNLFICVCTRISMRPDIWIYLFGGWRELSV